MEMVRILGSCPYLSDGSRDRHRTTTLHPVLRPPDTAHTSASPLRGQTGLPSRCHGRNSMVICPSPVTPFPRHLSRSATNNRGWHRIQATHFAPGCFSTYFVLRSTLPAESGFGTSFPVRSFFGSTSAEMHRPQGCTGPFHDRNRCIRLSFQDQFFSPRGLRAVYTDIDDSS